MVVTFVIFLYEISDVQVNTLYYQMLPHMTFEVVMAVKIHIAIVWVIGHCSQVVGRYPTRPRDVIIQKTIV
jgi:hypothetical protein